MWSRIMKPNTNHALVVLSGGQDSMTCLGMALNSHEKVTAIGFDYGQQHVVELESASAVCAVYDVDFEIVKVPALSQFNDSALLSGNNHSVNEAHSHKENLPASFVPARNAMFLTLAHGYAQKINAGVIYTGVCQTDYSGYPDCRAMFIDALQLALNLGYETNIEIYTPLMYLNKAETFELAEENGFLDVVLFHSHTCYNGVRDEFHGWGYGCGECPACELRANGYNKFMELKNESEAG